MTITLDVTHITPTPVECLLPFGKNHQPYIGRIAVSVDGDVELEKGPKYGIVVRPYKFSNDPEIFIFGMWNWYDTADEVPGAVVTLNYGNCTYSVTHLDPEEGYTNAFEHLCLGKIELVFYPEPTPEE